jgi:hypothetical protein
LVELRCRSCSSIHRSPQIIVMARDRGLEAIIYDDLRDVAGVSDKAMFGGWAWLLNGKLLCGARDDGLLVRLGKGNDAWALALPGVDQMISRGKRLAGWIRADERVFGDDRIRHLLLSAAVQYVRCLPV